MSTPFHIWRALDAKAIHVNHDKPYLPTPNRVEVVLARGFEAPAELTKSAFMLPLRPDGTLIMARNTRRGVEFAGGHVDGDETLEEAARRECLEETGCLVMRVRPIGFLRMISEGEAPENWVYPHPHSFQQFYAGLVAWENPGFVANDECHHPVEYRADRVQDVLPPERYVLYKAAREALGLNNGRQED